MLRNFMLVIMLSMCLAVSASAAAPVPKSIDSGIVCTTMINCVYICKNNEVLDVDAAPNMHMMLYAVFFGLLSTEDFMKRIAADEPKNLPMAVDFVMNCMGKKI